MNQTLKDKRALVTGGSRGIGAAIVKRLAAEGAHVAFTYSSSPDRAGETARAAQALGANPCAPILAGTASSEDLRRFSRVEAGPARAAARLGTIARREFEQPNSDPQD